MRVGFVTLGCKTNQFESQATAGLLRELGYEIVSAEEPADCYILNSCTVTAVADKKSRQSVRHLKRLHPEAVVAVCGCLAQLDRDQLYGCGADLVGGNRDHRDFVSRLDAYLKQRAFAEAPAPVCEDQFCLLPAGGLPGHTRALLKIEDGCQNYCSYCIIPFARGKVRSLPLHTAVAEAERLTREGYREIVLTGIEISAYGTDLPGRPGLTDLVENLCLAVPETRIHLGSLHPTLIDGNFCQRLEKLDNLCRHFHLSLQSCCTQTLKRMHRRYGAEEIGQAVRALRSSFPDANITADLIAGFPGETEEEFAQTMALLEEISLADAHIFPYSIRPGTVAAKSPLQLTRQEKEARAARATDLCAQKRQVYLSEQVGKETVVLLEERTAPERIGGYDNCYRYIYVHDGGRFQKGQQVTVRITGTEGDCLTGQPV